MENLFRISLILRFVSSIMLLLALGYHPYSYYIMLRWVVFVSSFYSVWVLSKLGRQKRWTIFFLISGVLFNPIIPIHLSRSIWQPIDVIFAIIFLISLVIKPSINYENKK